MNPIARFERACSRFVEDTFARIFPGELDPARVGRKLVAIVHGTAGDLYLVRVHPADYGRFERDRDLLESRWSALIDEAQSGRRSRAVRAVLHADSAVAAGSVVIEAVREEVSHDARSESARALAIDLFGEHVPLRAGLRIGRASDNDVVVPDRRVSRYHARVIAVPGGFAVEDIGSSNGTFVGAAPATTAPLGAGTVLTLGDTKLLIEPHAR